MSLWTSLEPAATTVAPGDRAQVRLRVRNTGDVVDEYRFEPVGDLALYTRVEPPTLRLYPGTTGTVELTFAPPRTPDVAAGPHPFAVRIAPTEHPDAVTVPEGNVTVLPFTEVRAELVPVTVKGRFRGRPQLAVDNLGNTPLTAAITGSDNGDQLSYELRPGSVQIEPGRAAFVRARLTPRQITWVGSSQERPFTLAVQRSGAEPLPVEGTYVQRGVVPRWLVTVLGTLLALAVVFALLWLRYPGEVESLASERKEDTGSTLPPEPTEAPTEEPTEEPTEDPTEEPTEEEPEQPADDGGDGGGESEPEGPVPAANILLYNTVTELCADLPERGPGRIGGTVQQSQCTLTGDNQVWNLEVREHGPNDRPHFQIRNVADDLCMDLPGEGPVEHRSYVTEFTCGEEAGPNQLWWLEEREPNVYWIRNVASPELCLDVEGLKVKEIDVPLMTWECNSDDEHEWRILTPNE